MKNVGIPIWKAPPPSKKGYLKEKILKSTVVANASTDSYQMHTL